MLDCGQIILPILRRRFSDSHAPCGRRCAPESWDDTEVIPPFGTAGGRSAARPRGVEFFLVNPEAFAFRIDAGLGLEWQDAALRGLPEEVRLDQWNY